MNRIYQGKVTLVEIPDGKDNWKKLDDGEFCLWQSHLIFQNACNYYTLALAAMAAGLEKDDSPKGRALFEWRKKVLESWVKAKRKAIDFDGPHERLAKWLGVDKNETDAEKAFESCAKFLLKKSPASVEARAKALLQLLEEADASDLNQFCVSRLPWLCTPHGKLDATPKNVAQEQESRMLAIIHEIHEATEKQIHTIAEELELGWFVTQMPKESMSGAAARAEAERLFKSASVKAKGLAAVAEKFSKRLDQLGDKLQLPVLGRKPKGAYPLAVVFKLFPVPETWEAFKTNTESLNKKAGKLKDSPPEIGTDFIAEVRMAADEPVFDYFTNCALVREPGNEDRAVWFDFDLAAFIEAIKSPHRYFQDTLVREAAATKLREKLHAIDPDEYPAVKTATEKKKTAESVNDAEDETPSFTFANDERIKLLKKLVREELGYLAEVENPDSEKAEYTIQERTLRGWTKIREEWRKLAEKGKTTPDELWKVVKAEQGERHFDFGSPDLYKKLVETDFQPIWRDKGTQTNHADDPLQAWLQYKELQFELKDKERPIRFTPAHAVYSPRYFIIPKVGKFGSEHETGKLSFITGMILETADKKLKPSLIRIHYSAPRLRRDELRTSDEKNLGSANWLQPMMKALGLPEHDTQDFSNCRIILQPSSEQNIQLTFPVEVNCEKLIEGIEKLRRPNSQEKNVWARQFNQHPDGNDGGKPKFYNATLRWPHEKQPAKLPTPWFALVKNFYCISVDLGQRDAGAYAVLQASENPEQDFSNKPFRIMGKPRDKSWGVSLKNFGMFKLSGEDKFEWRLPSKSEEKRGEKGFDWREELFGERGRSATPEETQQAKDILVALEMDEKDFLQNDRTFSFPEQNGELLRALRRAQWRVSRLQRWCRFLADEEKNKTALKEIREVCGLKEDGQPKLDEKTEQAVSGEAWIPDAIKEFAKKGSDPRLTNELKETVRHRLRKISEIATLVANRVLSLRKRSWAWIEKKNEQGENYFLLEIMEDKNHRPPIRGQRGLSIERIEQIEDLRRRFQSLNQASRRFKALEKSLSKKWNEKQVAAFLKEEFPDPCRDLLEKLERTKTQRVNQTAHMILAEALGVRLAEPPANKAELRRERDQHGVYEKILDRNGNWRGVADFVVIEDLKWYEMSQGRAPKENSRLMKWCRRQIRQKLIELCEPFGLPMVEVNPADTSQFCSRSGVFGFRAMEIAPGFHKQNPWKWDLQRLEKHRSGEKVLEGDTLELALAVERLKKQMDEAEKIPVKHGKPRTLFAPKKKGGPIFIPMVDYVAGANIQPAMAQADINAAINIGLRAIADPRLPDIHPRFRAQAEKDGALVVKEKRKFDSKLTKKILLAEPASEVKAGRWQFFYTDVAKYVKWGHAKIEGENIHLVSEVAWRTVAKKEKWKRCLDINEKRIAAWKNKGDNLTM